MDDKIISETKLREIESLDYYAILQVPRDATSSQIKKSYYKMARRYHPDKNQGDPYAEEMFKVILEAYTVLMDEEKRKLYDLYGKEFMGRSDGIIDFSQLVSLLFGGHIFVDVVGEMKLYMLEGLMGNEEGNSVEMEERNELHKKERVEILIELLRVSINRYLKGQIEMFELGLSAGLDEKLEHPFGVDIMDHASYLYVEIGKKYMGRFFGVESFITGIGEKFHALGSGISLVRSGISLIRAQKEMQQSIEKGEALNEDSQKRFFDAAMYTLWNIGKLEIEEILRRVCEAVIEDPDPEVKRRKAEALHAAGWFYKERLQQIKPEQFTERVTDFQTTFS